MGSKKIRERRAAIARETLEILERGGYAAPGGDVVSIAAELDAARAGARHYRPEELSALRERVTARLRAAGPRRPATRFEVTGETTLAAARRLTQDAGFKDPACLNFASARNPGGGFLGGSEGQEECLARATGLYPCIANADMEGMYRPARVSRDALYSDHMIYAPRVPVLRDDDDALLPAPARVSIITAAAVNAGAVRKNQKRDRARIPEVMRARIGKLLALAADRGHEALVLGAWGCGVFQNDPAAVAGWFAEALFESSGAFADAFAHVVFAIVDSSKRQVTRAPFARAFRADA
ncbi:MAG: TIGR02452 family protein [Myxococcales bacterium]|nr:TIGR02452 family protein [Myxococcales bacterium]